MTTMTATDIVLEYVCPSLGLIVANLMFLAPLKDLQTSVNVGLGLGDLNPTPFAFMLGNCLGWCTYGVLINNWFVFWANYPGFLISCWLNLGAVKLLYSHHHQEVARTSLVHFLTANNNKIVENNSNRNLLLCASKDDDDDDTIHNNDNDDETNSTIKIKHGDDEIVNNTSSSSSSSLDSSEIHHRSKELDDMEKENKTTDNNTNDWAQIIWNVTSQTTPATIPHERLVMGIILLWTVVLSAIGFYVHYYSDDGIDDMSDGDSNGGAKNTIPQTIVGYVVNFNLVFFYGAPLSAINEVLKTKRSNSLHVPTMIMNTTNSIFWTAYALAPQINDPFMYVPNGLGVLLGTIQFVLYLLFPNTANKSRKKNKNNINTNIDNNNDDVIGDDNGIGSA